MKHVVRTRDTCFNRPRIDGTRMPTATVWSASRGGRDVDYVRENWPHLTDAQIMAAIRYERRWYRRLGRRLPRVTILVDRWHGDEEREITIGGWGW